MMKTGQTSEWQYSYTSYSGKDFSCRFNETSPFAFLSNYTKLPTNQYQPLMAAVSVGPVAISVMASTWQSYSSGVFNGCPFDENIDIGLFSQSTSPPIKLIEKQMLDHAVVAVGYGNDAKYGPYWLVRCYISHFFTLKSYFTHKKFSITPKGTPGELSGEKMDTFASREIPLPNSVVWTKHPKMELHARTRLNLFKFAEHVECSRTSFFPFYFFFYQR